MTDTDAKRRLSRPVSSVLKFFQLLLFIPVQIVFVPFAVIGLSVAIYKEFRRGRQLGVSFSAIKALQYRWIGHYFGVRRDPLSVEFARKFPCESHFGMWTVLGALIVAQRLFGFTTKGTTVVDPEETVESTALTRVLLFDRIIEKHAQDVEQVVLPGSGFDLIAHHFTNAETHAVYEVDQAKTLRVKVDTLDDAGIAHDWITYVPVDYANESWDERLLEAGFDRTKKTLFLWQSVSLYLDVDTVKETLRTMADLGTEGSVIAQDFYSRSFALGEYSRAARSFIRLIAKMGEPAKFGIDMALEPKKAVESFLGECGLHMIEYIQFGEKLDTEPFYCIVEAQKR